MSDDNRQLPYPGQNPQTAIVPHSGPALPVPTQASSQGGYPPPPDQGHPQPPGEPGYAQPQPGYAPPPQQAYGAPYQGYPQPQAGQGYAPSQVGYAPPQQALPAAPAPFGAPSAEYPAPAQGYPPPGYPVQIQGYPAPAYGAAPQGYPPPGYQGPPQGYPPQGYGSQAQGYPPPGYGPQPVNIVVQNHVNGSGMGHPGLVRVAHRDKTMAALLALFLGGFGVHKFYLGRTFAGVMYLIFSWTFIPGLLAFIDAIRLFTSSDQEFQMTYNMRLVG